MKRCTGREGVACGLVALALLAAVASACAPPPAWQTTELWGHPLVGRIWQPASGRFVAPEELDRAIGAASFVLLGEKHDNPDHHQLQARMLAELVRGGRRPALVWEMLATDQDERVAAFLASKPSDAAGLGPAVDWASSGWPDWSAYQPIADVAVEAGLPILSGSLRRGRIRTLMREGLEALEADEARGLGLDARMTQAQRAAMRADVVEAHCRLLPESMLDAMVDVTFVKDAFMARRLREGADRVDADGANGAVLIAGSGHVRRDRGVPWHLARQAPGQRVVAVGLLEVVEGGDDPAAYSSDRADEDTGVLPFDYIWFTPRADSEDPCAVHADDLRRAREKHEREGS